MINGIKIAKSLVVIREDVKEAAAAVSAGATALLGPGDVSGGINVIKGKDSINHDESHLGADVFFAYQLLILQRTGWRRKELGIDK
jgi:hypothetical protein